MRLAASVQHTEYANDFVLKGGMLLAAFRLRRPTSDIDMQGIDFDFDDSHLREVVAAVAGVEAEDGVVFDLEPTSIVTSIRSPTEWVG